MSERVYVGRRANGPGTATVAVRDASKDDQTGQLLPPCNDVVNHSPDGFEWGYGGSGPAQLALALCIDALIHAYAMPRAAAVARAQRVYQDVKFARIARIQTDSFTLTSHDIMVAILAAETHREQRPTNRTLESDLLEDR